MGGGVSAALLQAGGESVAHEAQKHVPAKIGDVIVTSAGRLHAKFIFHAITIDYANMLYADDDSIRSAVSGCLRLADSLQVRHLAFPALGTGVAGYPFQRAAETMARTIAEYILASETRLEQVTITLFARGMDPSGANVFYERITGLASVLAQGDRLKSLLADVCRSVERLGAPDLVQRVRDLAVDIAQAQRSFATEQKPLLTSADEEVPLDGLSDVSHRAVGLAAATAESSRWNDTQLESELLRTKLTGLLTQLNIKQSHLNRFEIEKAKYGGVGTPPRLEISIEELTKEMQELQNDVDQTRRHLARLHG
jgi:O-acetyl-ADP-ribose deacetylase (regulator of RNase III)